MDKRTNKIKWFNVLTIVIEDTGEIITRKEFDRRNLIIKSKEHEKRLKQHKGVTYGISRTTWVCGDAPNNDLSSHILSEELRPLNWSEQTEIHEVLNTPFCITRDKNGWNVTMGRYRMNAEPFKTWEEAFKDATTLDANKVLSMIICVNDFNNKQK